MVYDFDRVIGRGGTGSEKWAPFEDRDVIPMPVADMDFASPPELLEVLRERVDHGVFGYAEPTESLVKTVTGMCRRRYGWEVDPDWIVWLPGLVCGINVTCRAIGQPGDAVMTATPVYPPFLTAPRNMKRELVTVPLREDGGRWTFDWEAMEAAWKKNVRLFLLCQPHNPVGRVFDEEEIARLAAFCEERDIVLCSDEIHCDLILDDIPHRPTAMQGPEVARNTITLMAPSKTFNVPGLGCAFAIIPDPKLRAAFHQAKAGIVPQVGAFGYAGCEAAYARGEPWRQELIEYLRGNRDYLLRFAEKELPGIRVTRMQATYLAWFDVRPLNLAEPVKHFIDHGVALSDGRFFKGSGFVRMNFGCPRATLKEGLDRMRDGVRALT